MIRKPTAQERALMLETSDLRAQLQFSREERDRYRAALERILALDCETTTISDDDRKRGMWCDGPCGDIARAALKGDE